MSQVVPITRIKELRDALEAKVGKAAHYLRTEEGSALLDVLKTHFDHDSIFVPESPTVTAFRLGQRDVVRLLQYLQEGKK